jgi:hypothetical protein
MSRGMGRVERAILAFLDERSRRSTGNRHVRLDVFAQVTESHPESVRRAMRSLERRGLVELGYDNGWRCHPTTGEARRFWESPAPTARLSAGGLSALTHLTAFFDHCDAGDPTPLPLPSPPSTPSSTGLAIEIEDRT